MSENENAEEHRMEAKRGIERSVHPRFDWLDQFRGMVIVFLIIASLTWELSSNDFAAAPPLGPTWLNHGWKFFNQNPAMITIVDLGSQIFMFMLGISLGLSFKSKIEKKGAAYAWSAVLHRVLTFFWIVQLIDYLAEIFETGLFPVIKLIALGIWVIITVAAAVFRNLKKYENTLHRPFFGMLWALFSVLLWMILPRFPDPLIGSGYLKSVFFIEALSHLAWGTLFAALFVFLIKKPDYRIIVSIVIFTIHAILWEFEGPINTAIRNFWPQWDIPFDVLGMGAIAIAATCVWDWMNIEPSDQKIGMRKRVIPFFLIAGVLHFVVDFFQTADHHGINVSIGLLSLAFSTLLVLIFYSFEFFFKFKIPFLTHLGRNALFLFLFQGIFTITYPLIFEWNSALAFRTDMSVFLGIADLTHPLIDLLCLLAFLVPILIIYFVGWLFDKLNWHIRV
ncbi:MAG: hypothetical protein ACTSRE_12640 [Promethearchaeota archaeon]